MSDGLNGTQGCHLVPFITKMKQKKEKLKSELLWIMNSSSGLIDELDKGFIVTEGELTELSRRVKQCLQLLKD